MAAPPLNSASSIDHLLSLLSTASPRDLPRLKLEAEQLQQSLKRSHQAALSAESRVAKGTYDRWVLDVFRATEMVLPIEALLRDFARRFAEVHELKPGRGPWLLVVAGSPPHGGGDWQFQALTHAGLTAQQWAAIRRRLTEAADNPLLQTVFGARSKPDDLQLAYLPYIRALQEQGLFDELLGVRQSGAEIGANVWLKVQPLTHESGHVTHAVFVLYANRNETFNLTSLPAGAQGDQRALDILEPVYRQLSGQLRTLAELADRAKREMLSQIGAGLLHHEIGGGVRNMRAVANEALRMVKTIEEEYKDVPIEFNALATHVRSLSAFAQQVERTSDAFNQLDRRGAVTKLSLRELFDRAHALVKVRCGSLHVKLKIEATALEVQTDSTLLLHAVLNLIMNALDAIEHAEVTTEDQSIRLSAGTVPLSNEGHVHDEKMIWIEVANTGSKISEDIRHRLFQRGVTTRPGGHGQGLFLVRRIAQYCGGDAQLVDPAPVGFDVAFRMDVLRVLDSTAQLGLLEARQ